MDPTELRCHAHLLGKMNYILQRSTKGRILWPKAEDFENLASALAAEGFKPFFATFGFNFGFGQKTHLR